MGYLFVLSHANIHRSVDLEDSETKTFIMLRVANQKPDNLAQTLVLE